MSHKHPAKADEEVRSAIPKRRVGSEKIQGRKFSDKIQDRKLNPERPSHALITLTSRGTTDDEKDECQVREKKLLRAYFDSRIKKL